MASRQKRMANRYFNTNAINDGMIGALSALYTVPMTKEAFIKEVVPPEQYERLREAKQWAKSPEHDFNVIMRIKNGRTFELQLCSSLIIAPTDKDVTDRLNEPMFEPFRRMSELIDRWAVVQKVAHFWHNNRDKYPLATIKYYWPAGAHFLNENKPVDFPAKFAPIGNAPLEDIRESATILAMEKLIPEQAPMISKAYMLVKTSDWNYWGLQIGFRNG